MSSIRLVESARTLIDFVFLISMPMSLSKASAFGILATIFQPISLPLMMGQNKLVAFAFCVQFLCQQHKNFLSSIRLVEYARTLLDFVFVIFMLMLWSKASTLGFLATNFQPISSPLMIGQNKLECFAFYVHFHANNINLFGI